MNFYTNNKEIWKDIKGYEGLYKCSNFGRVISTKQKNGVRDYLIGSMNDKGYCVVSLNKDGVLKTFAVHRLVAEHFIPNPENKPEIDHIDTNPSNNRVSNLRWVTHEENMNNPTTKINRKKDWKEKMKKIEKENFEKTQAFFYGNSSYNYYRYFNLMRSIDEELMNVS